MQKSMLLIEKTIIKNTFDVADKKGNKINKTDANQATKQPRFYLIFGNFYGLDDIIKKKECLFDIKFPSNLTNFIANSFEKPVTEKTSIEEAIRNSSYCCYVIVDRKVKKMKSNNKDENLQDKVSMKLMSSVITTGFTYNANIQSVD